MLGILRLGKDVIIGAPWQQPPSVFQVHCMRCWRPTYLTAAEFQLVVLDDWPGICETCAATLEAA